MQRYKKIIFPDVGFECKNCVKCCVDRPGDLNDFEYKRILAKGYKDFLDESSNDYKQIKRKDDDSCHFLSEDNKCKIHDVKPAGCRIQPFGPVDYSPFTGRTIVRGDPLCEGVTVGKLTMDQLKYFGEAMQQCVDDLLRMRAQELGLPIYHKAVAQDFKSFLQEKVAGG